MEIVSVREASTGPDAERRWRDGGSGSGKWTLQKWSPLIGNKLEIAHHYCVGTPAYCARNSNTDVKFNFYIFATVMIFFFYINQTLCRQIKPICVLNPSYDHQLRLLHLKFSGRYDKKTESQRDLWCLQNAGSLYCNSFHHFQGTGRKYSKFLQETGGGCKWLLAMVSVGFKHGNSIVSKS